MNNLITLDDPARNAFIVELRSRFSGGICVIYDNENGHRYGPSPEYVDYLENRLYQLSKTAPAEAPEIIESTEPCEYCIGSVNRNQCSACDALTKDCFKGKRLTDPA